MLNVHMEAWFLNYQTRNRWDSPSLFCVSRAIVVRRTREGEEVASFSQFLAGLLVVMLVIGISWLGRCLQSADGEMGLVS